MQEKKHIMIKDFGSLINSYYLNFTDKPSLVRTKKDFFLLAETANDYLGFLLSDDSIRTKIFQAFHSLAFDWYEVHLDYLL